MTLHIPEDMMMRAGAFLDAHPDVRGSRTLVAPAMMEVDRDQKRSIVGLTHQQLAALDFIEAFKAAHRVAPTYDEIKTGLGLASKSGVHRLIHGLIERGALEVLPGRWRAMAVRRVA